MPIMVDFMAPRSSVAVANANRSCRFRCFRNEIKADSLATNLQFKHALAANAVLKFSTALAHLWREVFQMLEHVLGPAIFLNEFQRGLRSDSGYARHIVRRIADQGLNLHRLLRRVPVLLHQPDRISDGVLI